MKCPAKNLIPIYVNLTEYDGKTLLLDYLTNSVGIYGQFVITSTDQTISVARKLVNWWFNKSQLIIFLDGLDEVSYDNRYNVMASIEGLANTLPGKDNYIIISCRTSCYQEIKDLGDSFAHWLLKPLRNSMKSTCFMELWLNAIRSDLSKADIKNEVEKINKEISKLNIAKEIYNSPLLLRLALILWVETHKLENCKTELFRRYFVDVLIKRERVLKCSRHA